MRGHFLHTRSFERIHFSVFRYKWSKNGFAGLKTLGAFEKWATGPWRNQCCLSGLCITTRLFQFCVPPVHVTVIWAKPSWEPWKLTFSFFLIIMVLWMIVIHCSWLSMFLSISLLSLSVIILHGNWTDKDQSAHEMKNNFCLFERPFKIQKNGVCPFEISFFILEILTFFFKAN